MPKVVYLSPIDSGMLIVVPLEHLNFSSSWKVTPVAMLVLAFGVLSVCTEGKGVSGRVTPDGKS